MKEVISEIRAVKNSLNAEIRAVNAEIRAVKDSMDAENRAIKWLLVTAIALVTIGIAASQLL